MLQFTTRGFSKSLLLLVHLLNLFYFFLFIFFFAGTILSTIQSSSGSPEMTVDTGHIRFWVA